MVLSIHGPRLVPIYPRGFRSVPHNVCENPRLVSVEFEAAWWVVESWRCELVETVSQQLMASTPIHASFRTGAFAVLDGGIRVFSK